MPRPVICIDSDEEDGEKANNDAGPPAAAPPPNPAPDPTPVHAAKGEVESEDEEVEEVGDVEMDEDKEATGEGSGEGSGHGEVGHTSATEAALMIRNEANIENEKEARARFIGATAIAPAAAAVAASVPGSTSAATSPVAAVTFTVVEDAYTAPTAPTAPTSTVASTAPAADVSADRTAPRLLKEDARTELNNDYMQPEPESGEFEEEEREELMVADEAEEKESIMSMGAMLAMLQPEQATLSFPPPLRAALASTSTPACPTVQTDRPAETEATEAAETAKRNLADFVFQETGVRMENAEGWSVTFEKSNGGSAVEQTRFLSPAGMSFSSQHEVVRYYVRRSFDSIQRRLQVQVKPRP